jgi:hypothetical protein
LVTFIIAAVIEFAPILAAFRVPVVRILASSVPKTPLALVSEPAAIWAAIMAPFWMDTAEFCLQIMISSNHAFPIVASFPRDT